MCTKAKKPFAKWSVSLLESNPSLFGVMVRHSLQIEEVFLSNIFPALPIWLRGNPRDPRHRKANPGRWYSVRHHLFGHRLHGPLQGLHGQQG